MLTHRRVSMESQTRSTAKLPDHPAFTPPAARHSVVYFFIWLFAVVVLASATYATYAFEHRRVTDLQTKQAHLQSQAASLQQKIMAAKAEGNTQ